LNLKTATCRKNFLISILICLLFLPILLNAQDTEDVKSKVQKEHSPKKATLYSMLLPGLGQAYNKKYWKIPIIYAGFGVMGYFMAFNSTEYRKFRAAYNFEPSGTDTIPPNDYYYRYDKDALGRGRDDYRRNLEFTYILTGIWYILNIVDASVDAHLFNYDISDDLSLRIEPVIHQPNLFVEPKPGIKITFNF